jgi:hypothetical protein
MDVTDFIADRIKNLSVPKDYEDWTIKPEKFDSKYHMFNTGGVEIEVGEFLYGLVRLIKPNIILETGTYVGIATSYMALALKQNQKGKIITIEAHQTSFDASRMVFQALNIQDYIESIIGRVEDFNFTDQADMLFLDTEPNTRFKELERFWGNLLPGAIIGIHDLKKDMGQESGLDWGEPSGRIKQLIVNHELQSIHFDNPRGLYIGQKSPINSYTKGIMDLR